MAKRKNLTKKNKARIVELRCAGLSYDLIKTETGFSISAIGRVCREANVSKGAIETDARDKILDSIIEDQTVVALRKRVAALIESDIENAIQIRNHVSQLLEKISYGDDEYFNHGAIARTLATATQTLKTSQELYRNATGKDSLGREESQLTKIAIVEMTAEEAAEAQLTATVQAGHKPSNDKNIKPDTGLIDLVTK